MEKVITFPDGDKMLERLMAVSSESYLRDRFYSILLKFAREKHDAKDVVVTLVGAISDFLNNENRIMKDAMYKQAPEFIDALVSDAKVAEKAKRFLQRILSKTK